MRTPICLSLAVPAYNEEQGLESLLEDWLTYLKQCEDIAQFELIICNDGSTDQTKSILDAHSKAHPEIRPLHFKHHQGAAAALATAIKATQYEWVLLLDSDGQFPIENLSTMIATMQATQAMAVLGVRNKKDRFFARFGTKASGFICNLVHGSQLKDFNSALKLVSGPLLRSLRLEAKGMNYSTEISSRLLESRIPILEIDIIHKARIMDKSKMKWFRDSMHRLLFVSYLSLRQLLLKLHILRRINEIE